MVWPFVHVKKQYQVTETNFLKTLAILKIFRNSDYTVVQVFSIILFLIGFILWLLSPPVDSTYPWQCVFELCGWRFVLKTKKKTCRHVLSFTLTRLIASVFTIYQLSSEHFAVTLNWLKNSTHHTYKMPESCLQSVTLVFVLIQTIPFPKLDGFNQNMCCPHLFVPS